MRRAAISSKRLKSFATIIADGFLGNIKVFVYTQKVMAQQARQPEPAEEPVGEQAQVRPAQDPEVADVENKMRELGIGMERKVRRGRPAGVVPIPEIGHTLTKIPDYRLAVYPDNSVKLFRLMDNVVKISAYYDLDPLTIYKAYFQTEEA
eukprot:g27815.t1